MFKVIDTKTGKEPTKRVITNIARKGRLMEMDIDGFYVDETDQIILVDDCGNCTWVDGKRFKAIPSAEPCEDAISRQALLKLMGEEPFNWTDSDKELQAVEDYRNFRNMVEQLPSVKPQEKTGHWKRISMDKYSEHAKYWYRCDKCGKDNLGNTDWCPNCGAKMV